MRQGQGQNVIPNSGVMFPPIEQVTADGHDLQFGTNVIGTSTSLKLPRAPTLFYTGHYYFTKLLLPTMIATAKTTLDGKARIVNTSSAGHLLGHLDFDTFRDSPARRKSDTNSLYFQSKFVRLEIRVLYDRLRWP